MSDDGEIKAMLEKRGLSPEAIQQKLREYAADKQLQIITQNEEELPLEQTIEHFLNEEIHALRFGSFDHMKFTNNDPYHGKEIEARQNEFLSQKQYSALYKIRNFIVEAIGTYPQETTWVDAAITDIYDCIRFILRDKKSEILRQNIQKFTRQLVQYLEEYKKLNDGRNVRPRYNALPTNPYLVYFKV